MVIKYLDGNEFYNAFEYGTKSVLKNKEYLNLINYYPVPDSDTGTNLAMTLNFITLKTRPESSIYNTIKSISNHAVKAARGNSGLIFAQFLTGLYTKMKESTHLSTKDFAKIAREASHYLYENIEDPVEGTMITVIKDWSNKLDESAKKVDDFVLLFNQSLKSAHKSLEETRNGLKVLKEMNIVDAGAQGFVYFIEGMLNYLKEDNYDNINKGNNEKDYILDVIDKNIDMSDENDIYVSSDLKYRYCTEAYMINNSSEAEIKEILKSKGDSLHIVSSGDRTRFHIHTNNPAEIMYLLKDKGKILEQKVDDMKRQDEVVHKRNSQIGLVTDSIADLPEKLIDKYQIHLIPVNIIIDEVNYMDKLTINLDYFYNYLENAREFPSSSQPTVDYIYNKLLYLSNYYDSLLIISVSSALSGTTNSFQKAIEKVQNEKDIEIFIIDSKLNSGAQGLLVLKAAEEIAAGKKISNVINTVLKYKDNSRIFVNLDTLEYMVKGGRISPMTGFFAKLFNLKPIVSLNKKGEGAIYDKAFSRKGVSKKIMKMASNFSQKGEIEKYAIVHADAERKALEYKEKLRMIFGFEAEYIMNISSVTALNSGKGSIALSILAK